MKNLAKKFRTATILVAGVLTGIIAGQDNLPKDSLAHFGDEFVNAADTTRSVIKDSALIEDLNAYDTLKKVYNISLDSSAALAKNLPIERKTYRGVLDFARTLPKP